jgi:hypothetical protein
MVRRVFHRCGVVFGLAFAAASTAGAATIPISSSPLSISALSPTGTSFSVTGSVNSSDTLDFSVTGNADLQAGPAYGTNAAGVVITPGMLSVESAGTVSDVSGTTPFGALILSVGGQSAAVFPADAANGLGSSSAPQTLTFDATLASLFGSFSTLTNPTFTFTVADSPALYGDNSNGYTVEDLSGGSSGSSTVPLPAAAWQTLFALGGLMAGKKLSGVRA